MVKIIFKKNHCNLIIKAKMNGRGWGGGSNETGHYRHLNAMKTDGPCFFTMSLCFNSKFKTPDW